MSTSSEIWNDILKNKVEKDDPLWNEYLDKAAAFDERMVDEWNKIVDVLLVYVALFISILTSFILQTFTQFQRNPADITNGLLVAIYNQQLAQSNNISIPSVDPSSYFNQSQADYDAAVTQNALLFSSLSLSIIVSVIALAAKLWLVSYSHQAFSVGSPYDRAMRRQEAYNGILAWNMGGVINMLPIILLIALCLFGFFIYTSVYAVQNTIGLVVEGLFIVGLLSLVSSSLLGAIFSGCPFRSAFSDAIRRFLETFQKISKPIEEYLSSEKAKRKKRLQWLWIGTLAFLWVASSVAVGYAALKSIKFVVLFNPGSIAIAYSAQLEAPHTPQKYKMSYLAAWMFFFISLLTIVGILFDFATSIFAYTAAVLCITFACWMVSKLSKSMAATGEIDAIAWLLKTAPPQYPAKFFKKAGQMTGSGSIGRHYRPRLLESLMPLLTLLITSEHHTSHTHSPSSKCTQDFKIELKSEQSDDLNGQHGLPSSRSLADDDDIGPIHEDSYLKNLEIYTACLGRLSEFKDSEGSFWRLWEDAMQHPKLEQPLIDKLMVLANPRYRFQVGLRSAAIKVLNNYDLDTEGNSVGSPATVEPARRVATVLRSATTLMINVSGLNSQEDQEHPELYPATRVGQADSSGEIGEVRRGIGDSGMC